MVEGGKTPMLSPRALAQIGVRLAVYHPLLFSSVHAMRQAAQALRRMNTQEAPPMATMDQVKQLVGMPEYAELEQRYAAGP